MRRLSEQVDRREPAFAVWFEAEQQLGMFRLKAAADVLEVIHAERPLTAEDNLAALEKFMQWLSEFSNNVRYWRAGSLSAERMREQANTIEGGLRTLGGWLDDPMPWRKGR